MDEFTREIFFEIHKDLPREGPGSNECTRRAWEMIPNKPDEPVVLDIGCGPGMQTRELARLGAWRVVGVDNHQPFLDALMRDAEAEGVSDHIGAVNASMLDLPYNDGSFDVIWCEGAIFIIGFAEGLRQWKRLLKPKGYVALTEATWLKPDPPAEIRDFWAEVYPAITDIEGNLAHIVEAGYEPIGHFTLPESDWLVNYYEPILNRLPMLRDRYAADPAALSVLDAETREIDLYRRFSEWYGYVFYIVRRSDGDAEAQETTLQHKPQL